jgi:hypothetical protein
MIPGFIVRIKIGVRNVGATKSLWNSGTGRPRKNKRVEGMSRKKKRYKRVILARIRKRKLVKKWQ